MLKFICKKILSLQQDENGAVILMTLGMFLFLYMLCISVYAIGTSVHERIRLQNIADAAAYSAAVAQADGLSRVATINRALSWTYIQMTRQQMDYIVHKWLKKTVTNFNQDLEEIKKWNKKTINIPSAKYENSRSWYIYIPSRCGTHNSGKEDPSHGTCWAGWTPDDKHQIRLNYATEEEENTLGNAKPEQFGFLASKEDLEGMLLDASGENQLRENIQNCKDMLNQLNFHLISICNSINYNMDRCARQVLINSIPKDELEDYRFQMNYMYMGHPYDDTSGLISNFSPYKNTEEDELELLSMTMPTSHLHDVFGDGIDQWFVRGHEKVLTATDGVVYPNMDNYAGYGIQRGYKTANRVESTMQGVKGDTLRGNHIAASTNFIELIPVLLQNVMALISCPELWPVLLIDGGMDIITNIRTLLTSLSNLKGDINPSCFNSKRFFAEQCGEVDDNFGLVSEYHWASMRWWCATEVHFRRIWKIIFIDSIKKKHYKLRPKSECDLHGYNDISKMLGTHTRADYKPCAMGADDISGIQASTHSSANKIKGYIIAGHSRIYGDDKDIYDDFYTGAKVMPVKLNDKYYQSANLVALAKKRRNPLTWAAPEDERLDTGNLIDNSLYALFNMLVPKTQNVNGASRWIVAVAASRAAARERSVSGDREGYLPGRIYQTKYSVMSSDQVDQSESSDGAPIRLHVAAADGRVPAHITKAPYRFGCPHPSKISNKIGNKSNEIDKRLKKTWNLCETDWDAVFVPFRFNTGEFTSSFDGLLEDSQNVKFRRKNSVGQDGVFGVSDMLNREWQSLKTLESESLDMDVLARKSDAQSVQSYRVSDYIRYIQNNIYKSDK